MHGTAWFEHCVAYFGMCRCSLSYPCLSAGGLVDLFVQCNSGAMHLAVLFVPRPMPWWPPAFKCAAVLQECLLEKLVRPCFGALPMVSVIDENECFGAFVQRLLDQNGYFVDFAQHLLEHVNAGPACCVFARVAVTV